MTYTIFMPLRVRKIFKKLPDSIQKKITHKLTILEKNPFDSSLDIKKIVGAENYYRLRINDYRIIYSLENHILTITIIHLGHRKDVYK